MQALLAGYPDEDQIIMTCKAICESRENGDRKAWNLMAVLEILKNGFENP